MAIVQDACPNGLGFVKRNKARDQWEEVSYAAAREKVGYTFRDLLADRYKSSSKSKVARLRATREEKAISIKQEDGEDEGGRYDDEDQSTSSDTSSSSPSRQNESDENPLEWREDLNTSLKSVFDEVLHASTTGVADRFSTSIKKKTPKKRKRNSSKKKIKTKTLRPDGVPSSIIARTKRRNSPVMNMTIETLELKRSQSNSKKPDAVVDKKTTEAFERLFSRVFGNAGLQPLSPRTTKRVCNFFVRSGGEKNSI